MKDIMTKREIKNEMARWVDSGFKQVWCNTNENGWITVLIPSWTPAHKWIVDDEHAELRKLQFNKPNTKFQMYNTFENVWEDAIGNALWLPNIDYQVKPEPVYEYQWLYKYTPDLGEPIYLMTEKYHTRKETILNEYYGASEPIPFEPSKRERK